MKDFISSLTLIIPLARKTRALLIFPLDYHKALPGDLAVEMTWKLVAGTEWGSKAL